jgi:hypothetical protein
MAANPLKHTSGVGEKALTGYLDTASLQKVFLILDKKELPWRELHSK